MLLGLVDDVAPINTEGYILGVEEDAKFRLKTVGKASSVFLVGRCMGDEEIEQELRRGRLGVSRCIRSLIVHGSLGSFEQRISLDNFLKLYR
jgi:hypothetical protein